MVRFDAWLGCDAYLAPVADMGIRSACHADAVLAADDLHECDGRAHDADRSADAEIGAGACEASGLMTGKATHKDKVEHPAESYLKPADLVRDEELSLEQKKKAPDTWKSKWPKRKSSKNVRPR